MGDADWHAVTLASLSGVVAALTALVVALLRQRAWRSTCGAGGVPCCGCNTRPSDGRSPGPTGYGALAGGDAVTPRGVLDVGVGT